MSHVETCPHECEGRFKYPQWGLAPYWGLTSVMLGPPFEGHLEFGVDVDGERWHLEVYYQKSGFAPRLSDNVASERLYEWNIKGRGRGERKCSFNISPRFPNMRHWETREPMDLPWENQVGDVEGVDVEFRSSNVEPDTIPDLLQAFYAGVFQEADERVSRQYWSESPHQASTIHAYERYVRIRREWAEKLISAGVMHKIMLLLADTEGAKAEYKIDNEEVVGHMHRCLLRPDDAKALLPGHHRGKQLKNYLLENANSVSKDHPSYHPKYGVLVKKKLNGGDAFAWSERDDLREEIDETILNTLNWADVPLAPDGTAVYVADDHFDAVARETPVELYDDPTPRLEAQQEHLLMTTLRDMRDSEQEIAELVATDGGQSVDDLEEKTGYHTATVYRAINGIGEILQLEDGHVSYRARKYREELRAIAESAESAIESYADRMQHIMGLADHLAESSPFQEWLATNGAEIVFDDAGDPRRLRIDTVLSWLKSDSFEDVQAIATEALEKWVRSGNDPAVLRRTQMTWKTPDGGTESGFVGTVADR